MNIRSINVKKLAISISVPLGIGILSFLASGGTDIYNEIKRPPLSPPPLLFPIVWTILYILMGISAYLAEEAAGGQQKGELFLPYYVQLAVNFLWSILFFRFRLFGASAVWLAMLIVWIISMINSFDKADKTAAVLQIPYLLWCGFALYLNAGIFLLNR